MNSDINSRSAQDLSEKWIRPNIRALNAYHVPLPQDAIKLDAMENPYTWSDEMVEAWTTVLKKVSINRYPDANASAVKTMLRKTMQVPDTMEILLGNGSDELIQILAMALNGAEAGQKACLLSPEPGFVMYKMIATTANINYVGVPLLPPRFTLDMEAMLTAIKTHQPALIFIAYPNNPTGNIFERHEIETIIKATSGLVVIDEAYCAFAEDSFMPDLIRFDNLLVMRTVSKIGLAGLRLGLLAGSKVLIGELEKLRLPYNINVLTQASAEFALQHYDILLAQTKLICDERAILFGALRTLPDIKVWVSHTNFILFRVPKAKATHKYLAENGVLIKCLDGSHPLLKECLRVTVGKPNENRTFLNILRQAMQHI